MKTTLLPILPVLAGIASGGPLPDLLFHAPFDGSAVAAVAKGGADPVRAEGIEFAESRFGQAVRLTRAADSALEYSAPGNLIQERGSVSFWFKREWNDLGYGPDDRYIARAMFANPTPKGPRNGSGELWFWNYGDELRVDPGDVRDSYCTWRAPFGTLASWHLFTAAWNERGVKMYVDGRFLDGTRDSFSPIRRALYENEGVLEFARETFDVFSVGGRDGTEQFDGLIDELRIYAAPLTPEQVREIYLRDVSADLVVTDPYAVEGRPGSVTARTETAPGVDLSGFRYILRDKEGKTVAEFREKVSGEPAELSFDLAAGEYLLSVTDGKRFLGGTAVIVFAAGNPYLLSDGAARPGVPENLELVQELKLDSVPPPDRFRSVGEVAVKHLGDTPFLEAGSTYGDRFALRLKLDPAASLHCVEIDYPDDTKRTADIIIQHPNHEFGDYEMQVGYAAGGEYRNTGRILTHSCLLWSSTPETALEAMTAKAGEPAAVAAVRVYRVKGAALPPARIGGADEHRHFALYFEDPSLASDFSLHATGSDPAMLETFLNRVAAGMKYTGEDTLAYPGAWYQGLMGRDGGYNPHGHAPYFLDAFYTKFDAEGLFLVPTMNVNTIPVPDGLITKKSLEDGSLHPSVVAIQRDGRVNSRWHGSPPGFNFYHPEVRNYILRMVDTLIGQGAPHPSFKGVCLHLTRHCLMWFGDEESGYNDYMVDAFAKAKGLTIPADRADPLRGRTYYEWIRANAWEDWIQWRCDVVTEFYAEVARRLAAARPDLKLWVNSYMPTGAGHPDFMKPEYIQQANRCCGLDGPALSRAAPNLILCQSMVPADYRKGEPGWYPSPEAREWQGGMYLQPGYYSLLRGADFPWVNQHDRYWESAIGRGAGGKPTLSCDWLRECVWRVTTINPSGFNALRHFAVPFRHHDVLGLSKGGFLIGTYGMEETLAPFVQAFRALPPVVFDDVPPATVAEDNLVRVRAKEYKGRSYFYAVNTGVNPVSVKLTVPAGTRDLVSGQALAEKTASADVTLDLGPYEFRSFDAPSGRPAIP